MEYNLCYDIDYKCVFDVDRDVFWATRIKHVSHRNHRVRLLYPALAVSDSNNGDSNPGSLDCESGILPTELPRSTVVIVAYGVAIVLFQICMNSPVHRIKQKISYQPGLHFSVLEFVLFSALS